MHRSRLAIGVASCLAVAACKSKEEASAAPSAKTRAQRLTDVPSDVIYAGSAHVRVIDAAAGQVVAGIDLQKSITAFAFTPDGLRGFVAASDGVRELDLDTHRVKAQLTRFPARGLHVSEDGSQLFVLEHEIIVGEGGTRDIQPFRLVTIDLVKNAEVAREEIAHGVLAVLPSTSPERNSLMLMRSGEVRLVKPPGKLMEAAPLDLRAAIPSDATFGIRGYVAKSPDGKRAYLPLEGKPSRIAEVDLVLAKVRAFDLGAPFPLRGLALTPDGKSVVVDALQAALLVDVEKGAVVGRADLGAAHIDAAMAIDGQRVYFACPVEPSGGTNGAITVVRLDGMKVQGRIDLPDISPWVLAVRPRASYASR